MTANAPTLFDPHFDDCSPPHAWVNVPYLQVPAGSYRSFDIISTELTYAKICDEAIRFDTPLEVRVLQTHDGIGWMSDVPQERAMMFNNAAVSYGATLVGGLGIGLYAQYALPQVTELTIVEQNSDIIEVVAPVVQSAAEVANVQVTIVLADIETVLRAESKTLYDTIFLDTWEMLNPFRLPYINQLRNMALHHMRPDGRLLLWGYARMLKLFQDTVDLMLEQPKSEREIWMRRRTFGRPTMRQMLQAVHDFTSKQDLTREVIHQWCRDFIINETAGETE